MKKFFGFLLHGVTLTVLALVVLSLLIWFFGPLLSFGAERRPLDGVMERLITIAALFALAGLIAAIRAWWRRRTNSRLVAGMAAGPSAAEREGQVLQQRFSEAIKVLDESARQTGKKGLFSRGAYLYELPWYMFIGAPGSGKTTALMNAGLNFPLAGKLGQASVRGVGGTRNCEWWFTDDAVLIDTAGRYTLQQSDEKTDAAAWSTFLTLLKKTRPRQPLNGVLLTVNIQDLLRQSPADRKDHAARLRTRLQEVQQALGVRPPVYVLVTKCDLIAGFNETFGELGREEREQVWGFTFPLEEGHSAAALKEFTSEFTALEKRLRDRLIERMEAESDVLRRAAVFAFPQQFSGLKGLLGGFLEQVFEGGGNLEEQALVRGVYFTSGTQEGTPIDRVLGTLSRSFGVDNKAASIASSRGKSFFLTRLLKEVVFAESGLVGVNRQTEKRTRLVRGAALAAMGLVALLLAGGWTASWFNNTSYIAEVEKKLPDLQKAVNALPPATGAELSVLPQVLDQVVAVPKPASFELADPPLLNTLGLYQGRHVQAGAEIGYRKLLDKALLPRLTRRLEERLRAANRDNLELAYEALKHYLMLYTPERFDAESLKAFISLDWDANLASQLSTDQRAALLGHLDAAFSRGAPPPATPIDQPLVANVREMLVAYPLEYRIFSRLKRARVGSDIPEFSAAAAGGPNAPRVFERASGQLLTRGVPGLFTRDGYFKAFKSAQGNVAKVLAAEQGWVLGATGGPTDAKGQAAAALAGENELELKVRRLYLAEYIKVWDAFIADVRLVKLGGIDSSLTVAGLLAAPDSPLKSYLRAVSRETQLAAALPESTKPGGAIGDKLAKIDKTKSELAALVGKPANDPTRDAGKPIEAMVDEHFAHIHRMVTGQPAPIDEVMKLFNDVYVQLTAIDAAQKSKTAPPPGAGGGGGGGGGGAAAKAAAAQQPEPIKSMLESLADAGATQGRSAERQGLTAELKPIAELCAKTIAGRYPFALGSRSDVLPDDFGQMFGVGGALDDFYNRRLSTLVDTGVTPWAFRPLPDGTKPPGGQALADFQRASRIREAFFRTGGKAAGFKVDLRVLEMDTAMKELTLDIDGQPMKFTAGSATPQTYTWPSARIASQIKLMSGAGPTVQTFDGPWALFRLFGQHEVQPSTQPERFSVVITLDGRKAKLEVISASALNPLRLREMQGFRCPETL